MLVVLDATEGMTDQDARLVGRAWEAGRGVILARQQVGPVPPARRDAADVPRARSRGVHPAFADAAAPLRLGAHGRGARRALPDASRASSAPTTRRSRRRRSTARCAPPSRRTPPPSPRGRAVRLFYATQTGRRAAGASPSSRARRRVVPPAYVRYLDDALREAFGLVGVPLRVRFRGRRDVPSERPRAR